MTEIQGAIGKVQLRRIRQFIEIRNNNARYLSDAMSEIKGIDPPYIPEYCEPAFNYWIGRIHPDSIGLSKAEFIERFPIQLNSINGGNRDNAIPRECKTIFFILPKYYPELENILNDIASEILLKFSEIEPNLEIKMEKSRAKIREFPCRTR